MENLEGEVEAEESALIGAAGVAGLDPIRQSLDTFKKEVTDKAMEVRETLKRFQGRVFHAVNTTHGYMTRYRIGEDGRIFVEKRLKGIYVTAEKLQEAKQNLVQAGKEVPIKAKRRWRKAVTGDPNKRIRDYMKETPQVKMQDKFSFTLGVIVICLSEFLILRMPNLFQYFYFALMSVLIAWRYYDYSLIKSELFLMDFCYFVNLSVFLQTVFYPNDLAWFKANYVLTQGPICIAIVVWRNSLVFHSLDKLTSFFLHAFPTMLCHIYRWKLVDHGLTFTNGYIGIESHLVYPLGIYFSWQVAYLLMTEVILRPKLDSDLEIVTSQRYLALDYKMGANKFVTNLCRKQGWLGPEENLNPETRLAKIAFVLSQFIYTILTIIHPPILFTSYYLCCAYLVLIFTAAVWNGASYYIEIFSKRYNMKFIGTNEALASKSDRKESTNSTNSGEDHDDEFTEALDSLDLDELFDELIDDDTGSSTSSKDDGIRTRELSEEPFKAMDAASEENIGAPESEEQSKE